MTTGEFTASSSAESTHLSFTSTTTSAKPFNGTSNQGLSHGAIGGIAGGVVGGLVALILGFSIIVLRYKKSGPIPADSSLPEIGETGLRYPDMENTTMDHSGGRLGGNTDKSGDPSGGRLGDE